MEKARILIVEDETIIASGIESKLQSLGSRNISKFNLLNRIIEWVIAG